MKRFFVTAKQIMLATVLFAGLSLTACDKDDDEPEKPNTEQGGNQKPEDQKPEDQKPEDQKPEDQKPEDQKPEDQKPEDQKPEDQKPEDQKPEDQKPETPENYVIGEGATAEVLEDGSVKLVSDGNYNGKLVYKFPEAVAAGKTIKIELDTYMVADNSKTTECQVVFQGADGTLKETNDKGETVDVCRYNWGADTYGDTQWTVGEGQTCTQIILNRQKDDTYFIVKSITVE